MQADNAAPTARPGNSDRRAATSAWSPKPRAARAVYDPEASKTREVDYRNVPAGYRLRLVSVMFDGPIVSRADKYTSG